MGTEERDWNQQKKLCGEGDGRRLAALEEWHFHQEMGGPKEVSRSVAATHK
jgi:hypothetical protein